MMTPSILGMTTDLTVALIATGAVRPDAMPQTLQTIHASLRELQERQERGGGGARLTQAERAGGESWKPSITQHAVTCLECGAAFKQLSTRHLRQHDPGSRSLPGQTRHSQVAVPGGQTDHREAPAHRAADPALGEDADVPQGSGWRDARPGQTADATRGRC